MCLHMLKHVSYYSHTTFRDSSKIRNGVLFCMSPAEIGGCVHMSMLTWRCWKHKIICERCRRGKYCVRVFIIDWHVKNGSSKCMFIIVRCMCVFVVMLFTLYVYLHPPPLCVMRRYVLIDQWYGVCDIIRNTPRHMSNICVVYNGVAYIYISI